MGQPSPARDPELSQCCVNSWVKLRQCRADLQRGVWVPYYFGMILTGRAPTDADDGLPRSAFVRCDC
eukprot:scaffold85854_cov37-Phaeocystis_antarctica.AAC.2